MFILETSTAHSDAQLDTHKMISHRSDIMLLTLKTKKLKQLSDEAKLGQQQTQQIGGGAKSSAGTNTVTGTIILPGTGY